MKYARTFSIATGDGSLLHFCNREPSPIARHGDEVTGEICAFGASDIWPPGRDAPAAMRYTFGARYLLRRCEICAWGAWDYQEAGFIMPLPSMV